MVAHLRWDLRMIFELAVNDGLLDRNPAELLYVGPSPARERRILTLAQASTLFGAFPLRERLILKLCGLVGLRPGEAFALQWQDLVPDGFHITRRVYRGTIDTPKSHKSTRVAAISMGVRLDLEAWRVMSPDAKPDDWIFPGKRGNKPAWPANLWQLKIRPVLATLELAWVNYQVLRRSTASLMNQLGIEGKTVADQLGHGLNVSQNVYTQAGIRQQQLAVDALSALHQVEREDRCPSACGAH